MSLIAPVFAAKKNRTTSSSKSFLGTSIGRSARRSFRRKSPEQSAPASVTPLANNELTGASVNRHVAVLEKELNRFTEQLPQHVRQLMAFTRYRSKVQPAIGDGYFEGFYETAKNRTTLAAHVISDDCERLIPQSKNMFRRVATHELLGHFLDHIPLTIGRVFHRGIGHKEEAFMDNRGFIGLLERIVEPDQTQLTKMPELQRPYLKELPAFEAFLKSEYDPRHAATFKRCSTLPELFAKTQEQRFVSPYDHEQLARRSKNARIMLPPRTDQEQVNESDDFLSFFPKTMSAIDSVVSRIFWA